MGEVSGLLEAGIAITILNINSISNPIADTGRSGMWADGYVHTQSIHCSNNCVRFHAQINKDIERSASLWSNEVVFIIVLLNIHIILSLCVMGLSRC